MEQTNHKTRCACLKADGTQCTRANTTTIPNAMSGNGHAYTYGKDVTMCTQHWNIFRNRRGVDKFWRMPLIHGGFVGCYNKYGFGDTVTFLRKINWDTVISLYMPKYWAGEDEK